MKGPDRNRFRLRAVLIAMVLVLAGTTAFLTFVAPDYLVKPLPLGIRTSEVATFARWLDRDRPEASSNLPVYALPHGDVPVRWAQAVLSTGGREGAVQWRRHGSRNGSLELTTEVAGLAGADPHVVLHPVGPDDIRHKYLQVIAEELGLPTPEVAYVQLLRNGRAAWYRKEAVPDAAWMVRHGMLDAVPFSKGFDPARPDHLHPVVESDPARVAMLAERLAALCPDGEPVPVAVLNEHIDVDAAAAWFLMLHLEGDPVPLARTQRFYYREATGKIFPVFTTRSRALPTVPGPTACDPFTPLLQDPAFMERVQAKREQLSDIRGQLRERFDALDKALLPQLADGGSVRMAQARAQAIADTLLMQRLGAPLATMALAHATVPHAGWATWHAGGTALPVAASAVAEGGSSLAEVRRRYWVEMRGDTIVFRRAKYKVQEDLILPAGHPVVMLSGARIEISPGRSLICQGPLEVRATDLNPVFIRASAGAPFGTFAVLANGQDVQMKGLRISGGAGATVAGVEYPAMLTIQGAAHVALVSCHMDMEHGRDVLSMEGGRLHVEGGRYTGGRVLLRRVQGKLLGAGLTNTGRQRASVGLQVIGGRLVLDSMRFEGFNDAALFAADGAQLLLAGGFFTRNGTALRCGDLSMVHADAARFERNALVLQVPAPGEGHGAGQFFISDLALENNDRVEDIAPGGSVHRRERLDASVRLAFGLRD